MRHGVGHHIGATQPWFSIRYTKPKTYVKLVVPLGRGDFQTYTAIVDNMKIARSLSNQGIDFQISGLFGKIWKSVKKVAKKTGLNRVIKVARKALPLVAKFTPPPFSTAAAGASMAIETAADLTRAKKARKRGKKGLQARYLQRALKRGKAYQKVAGRRKRRRAQKSGARLYRILVTPT
jgi:hypothetical protein